MAKPKTADLALVRKLNTSLVMDCVRLCAPISRAEVAARTGLNRSTVSSIVDELIDRGFIHETSKQESKVGRPGVLLQINPDGGAAVGIEIGVDYISVILTNFVAEILWQRRVPIHPGETQVSILERAENIISEAIEYGEQSGLRPLGIGAGVPGLVDDRQGKLVYAPNLKWVDMPIRLIWMQRFNLPVFVENEANCAALGEYFFGVAHDVDDFIYLSVGIGLGGGIMIDGKLFKGANGFGGEIGHTTIYTGGKICGCGRRGCWETYVSPSVIVERTRQKLQPDPSSSIISSLVEGNLEQVTLETIVAAAQQDDPLATEILHEVGSHLAVGISNLVNIFNPELVVLGGALCITGPWVTPIIRKALQTEILRPLREDIRFETSAQGWNACALGAVALVLDDIVQKPLYPR